MTLSKDQIGDKGQRYEISALIFPDGVKTIGWAETKEGATQFLEAIKLMPSCKSVRIKDRFLDE